MGRDLRGQGGLCEEWKSLLLRGMALLWVATPLPPWNPSAMAAGILEASKLLASCHLIKQVTLETE